jgi:hypothetical protein
MARKNPLDQVLAQIERDQQQTAADQQRQRVADHNARVNAHYDALRFLLAVRNAAEDAAIRQRFSGQGEAGL